MDMRQIVILLTILVSSEANHGRISIPLSGNYTTIAREFGFNTRVYDVVTEDGYILPLINIPGKREVVLLIHGIVDSADTFIIRGDKSLAITLAKAGYDVWSANMRGNRYSRRHVYLNPDKDKQFWNYSYHEMGYYDIPAIIDFILQKTGERSLSAIGHSLGNTVFYVMGSTRPEYNEKINVLIALSPICFFNHARPPVSSLLEAIPHISDVLVRLGQEEVMGDETSTRKMITLLCTVIKSYEICANGLLSTIGGSDPDELEPDFLPTLFTHFPTGTSRKTGLHLSQGYLKKDFALYDYGERNIEVYNSYYPPKYDLHRVTMKVVLLDE
ncbi:lipase 3-like [Colias croceus]|uniref:lipase 3-like n=1 Tax=Colias crocea TaxID=72248 RepID=UPI001E27B40B|nr:lipase 3-like [Colias croceus]